MKRVINGIKNLLGELPIALSDLFSQPQHSLPSLPANCQRHNQSRYYVYRNVPILELRGSGRQMGIDQAEILGNVMCPFVSHYMNSCLGTNQMSDSHKNLENFATRCREFIPNRFIGELHGIASRTPLTEKQLLSSSVFLDFYSTVMCSCVCLLPERSRTGHMLVGRNLDFPSMGMAHRLGLLVLYKPRYHYSFVSFTWPGMTGVLTGINEHGLYLAVAEVDGTNSFGPGLPYSLLHRRILEECKNVREAESLLRSVVRTRSNNLMVVDPNRASVLEYDRDRVVRRNPEKGVLYNTNHFVSPQIETKLFSFKYLSSIFRYRRMKQFFRRHQQAERWDVNKLLSRIALGRLNLISLLYEPNRKRVFLRQGAPPAAKRKPVSIRLSRLFDTNKTQNRMEREVNQES